MSKRPLRFRREKARDKKSLESRKRSGWRSGRRRAVDSSPEDNRKAKQNGKLAQVPGKERFWSTTRQTTTGRRRAAGLALAYSADELRHRLVGTVSFDTCN